MFVIVLQFSLFLLFWLLVSGSFDWQHIVFGSVVAGVIAAFWHQASERVVNTVSLKRAFLTLSAILTLVKEIWFAAWQVVPLVLKPKIDVDPALVHCHTALSTSRMRALYANSITLTPGTLTVELVDNRLLVHALTHHAAAEVVSWGFEKTLQRLEDTR